MTVAARRPREPAATRADRGPRVPGEGGSGTDIGGAVEPDEYATLVGKVVINLQSLEFVLRGFLYECGDPPHNPLPQGADLNSYRRGDVVPLNAMTCYDSLGDLIKRYNTRVAAAHPEWVVDPTIVELRDALAHGRISANDPSADMFLLKFGGAPGDTMRVTYAQQVTREWLKSQVRTVLVEVQKTANALWTSFGPRQQTGTG